MEQEFFKLFRHAPGLEYAAEAAVFTFVLGITYAIAAIFDNVNGMAFSALFMVCQHL